MKIRLGDLVRVKELTLSDKESGGYEIGECFEVIGKTTTQDGEKIYTKKGSGDWLYKSQLEKVGGKIKVGDKVRVKNFDGIEHSNFKPGEIFKVVDKYRNYTGRTVYLKSQFCSLYENQLEKVSE